MRHDDRELFEIINSSGISDYSKDALEETKNKSRQRFYLASTDLKISYFEFIWQQSRYIKKRWWLFQLFVLVILWIFTTELGQEFYIKRIAGISASVFAMLVIPEIWKNHETGSTEIECTCMYTLRQITGARILIFAFVDLLLLSLFGFTCVWSDTLAADEIMLQFLLPYVVTCCICFTCFYSRKHSILLAFVCCAAWCWGWTWIVLNDSLYSLISVTVWRLLLLVSSAYLVFCISKGQTKANVLWEVKTV